MNKQNFSVPENYSAGVHFRRLIAVIGAEKPLYGVKRKFCLIRDHLGRDLAYTFIAFAVVNVFSVKKVPPEQDFAVLRHIL